MRIGVMMDEHRPLTDTVQQAAEVEALGFDSAWFLQIFEWDALTMAALAGPRTSRIELGTGVIPVYTRHPFAMAQQALTVQSSAGGRFTLGVGLSHKPLVEGMWGLSYDKPARYMREYLSALAPLVREQRVVFAGDVIRTTGALQMPGVKPVPLLIAALAPLMLRLAGEVADGTITWMTGLNTLASHVVPRITKAAREAGRAQPRVVVALPVAVTGDPARAREDAGKHFAIYGRLENYQRMLQKEGAAGPPDVTIAGDEATVERHIRELAEAGATDFVAAIFPFGDNPGEGRRRTFDLLASLVGRIA